MGIEAIVQESTIVVPKGNYNVILESWGTIKERTYTDKITGQPKKSSYIDAFYKIEDGEYKDKLIKDNFSFYLSDNSELGKLYKELSSKELTAGEKIDLESVVGTRLSLSVEVEQKPSKQGGTFGVNKIKMRMKK